MKSKYSYILCGISGMVTVICALSHLGLFLVINGVFTVWNYYLAEARRREEEQELIVVFQSSQQSENKPNE